MNNGFKVKEEISSTYIKALAGHIFAWTDRATRRWLEIHLNHLPDGSFVHIHEHVMLGGVLVGNRIQEEVLGLTSFLKTQLL